MPNLTKTSSFTIKRTQLIEFSLLWIWTTSIIQDLSLVAILSNSKLNHAFPLNFAYSFSFWLPRLEEPFPMKTFTVRWWIDLTPIALPSHSASNPISISSCWIHCMSWHYLVAVFVIKLTPVSEWSLGFIMWSLPLVCCLSRKRKVILFIFLINKLFNLLRNVSQFIHTSFNKSFLNLHLSFSIKLLIQS